MLIVLVLFVLAVALFMELLIAAIDEWNDGH